MGFKAPGLHSATPFSWAPNEGFSNFMHRWGDREAVSLTTRIILSFWIYYISGALKSLKTTSGASRDVTYSFMHFLLCRRKRGILNMGRPSFQHSSHFKYSSKKVPTRTRMKKRFFFLFLFMSLLLCFCLLKILTCLCQRQVAFYYHLETESRDIYSRKM